MRAEVPQPEERRGRRPAAPRPGARRDVGVVRDIEERRQRRQADQLRLEQLDAVLGGLRPDRLPDPPQRRRPGSRGGSSRPGPSPAASSRSGSSTKNPFAWTFASPPPDSRTRRAIRFASSTSVDVEVDVPGDQERPGADRDRARRGVHPRRTEVRLAAVLADLGLEALVLAAPDVGQLDPVGPPGGPGVEVDGQVEPLGDPRRRTPGPARPPRPSSCRRAGTNGMTSTAPIRGCSPQCSSMSISRTAAATSASRASDTAPAGPARVNTERLWLASLVRSRRWTPGDRRRPRRRAGRRRRAAAPRRRSGRIRSAGRRGRGGSARHRGHRATTAQAAAPASGAAATEGRDRGLTRVRWFANMPPARLARHPAHSSRGATWPPPPPRRSLFRKPNFAEALDRRDDLALRDRDQPARDPVHRGRHPQGVRRARSASSRRSSSCRSSCSPCRPASGSTASRRGGSSSSAISAGPRCSSRSRSRLRLGVLTIWQLYVVGFVNGVMTVFFDVADQSLPADHPRARRAGRGQREAPDQPVRGPDPRPADRRRDRRAAVGADRGAHRRGQLPRLGGPDPLDPRAAGARRSARRPAIARQSPSTRGATTATEARGGSSVAGASGTVAAVGGARRRTPSPRRAEGRRDARADLRRASASSSATSTSATSRRPPATSNLFGNIGVRDLPGLRLSNAGDDAGRRSA